MFKQSIRTSILTVFILLTIVVSSALMLSQYYFSKQLAIKATNKDFSLIAKNITGHLDLVHARIKSFLDATKINKDLYAPINLDYKHPALNDMIQIINIDPFIYALYFTDEIGSFYEIINGQIATQIHKKYHTPKNTRWILLISKNSKTIIVFLDKYKKLISQKRINKKILPKTRTWYKQAISTDKIATTGVYKFHSTDTNGLTFATQLDKKGSVFAIDYTVDSLDVLLKSQRFDQNSKIFIFNKNTDIVSSSHTKHKHIKDGLLEAFQKNEPNKTHFFKKDGVGFLNIYKPLDNNLYLGIIVPSKPLYAPYVRSIQYSFSIAFLMLLVLIPIIFFVTNRIVKPIKELITENDKIKNRNFSEVKNINTNIIEFIELSQSFVNMSSSISTYQKAQADLLDAIVKLIAEAVDAKSHYTGGHCERVPQIAELLIHAASESKEEIFQHFSMTDKDALKEFEIGAWLHDCGKVTTPEYVVDKATKLETINNRIHEIRTRFEVLWRDAQIVYLEALLHGEDKQKALEILNTRQKQLLEDFDFLAEVNVGGEFMSPEKQVRVKEIANQEWQRHFDNRLGLGELELMRFSSPNQTLPATEKILSDKAEHIIQREYFNYEQYKKDGFKEEVPEYLYNYGEIYNLCIEKGTLTTEERYKINEHVIMSIKMLEKIPFPANMTKIPEYAGTHHETLIGTGYPRKLTKEDLSIPARIMAIADIFEALTASDRPYKKAKTLSQSLKIMSFMVKDQYIDKDIFELFLREELYLTYAKQYLKDEQIDEVCIEDYI